MATLRSDLTNEMVMMRTELGGQIESLRLLLLRGGSALIVSLCGVIAAILLRGV